MKNIKELAKILEIDPEELLKKIKKKCENKGLGIKVLTLTTDDEMGVGSGAAGFREVVLEYNPRITESNFAQLMGYATGLPKEEVLKYYRYGLD